MYCSIDNACIYYRQHGTRNFPRSYGCVLILSAIHRHSIVITVMAGARVYRDGGKTPVLFQKTTNGRWISKQQLNCLGSIRKNIRGCLRRHRLFFSSADHYGVRRIKLYLFCFSHHFFQLKQSLNSPMSNPQLSSNHRQILYRSTIRYLDFLPGGHRLMTKNRLKVDCSLVEVFD